MSQVFYRAYAIPDPSEASINRSINKGNSPYRPATTKALDDQINPSFYVEYSASDKNWLLVYKITSGESYLLPTETENTLSDGAKFLIGSYYWRENGLRWKDVVRGNSTSRKLDKWNKQHIAEFCQDLIDNVIFTDGHDTPYHRADLERELGNVVELLQENDVTAAHYEMYRIASQTSQHVNIRNVYNALDGKCKELYRFYPWLNVASPIPNEGGRGNRDFTNAPGRDPDIPS